MSRPHNRLLFVIHYPVFGGPHNQALRLNEPLRERGWDQVVVLPDEPGNAAGRLREAGVAVRAVPLQRVRAVPDARLQLRVVRALWPDIQRIRALIRELNPALVMLGGLVNPHAAIAARLEGVPVVWQIVDTRAPMLLRRAVMPLVSQVADSVLCTGTKVATAHPGALALGERLIPFFPPVDTDEFAPAQKARSDARAQLGLRDEDVVVGMVGNINPQKGQETFVAAAAALRRLQPKVRFVILGASYPQHATYAEGLWSKAANVGLRLDRDLKVTDPGSRVAELAAAFDVFWLTSEPRSEGIPTVVEEAMSLGLPVVSTDVGSVSEAVEHEITGFLVAPHDVQALARVTDRLIRDSDLRIEMGKAARRYAVSRFGSDQCADVHLTAFAVARHRAAIRNASAMRTRLGVGRSD